METYKCSQCHNTYEKGWSEEEANNEAMQLFGLPSTDPSMVVICDDCFINLLKNVSKRFGAALLQERQ